MQASFDPSKWIGFKDKEAETARVQTNADRDFGLREDESKRRAAYEQRMLVAANRTATAAERKAAGEDGPAQVTLKDMREFEDDVLKRLGPEFDPKNLDEGERNRMTRMRNDIATRASGIFRVNAERGAPVTAEVALNAIWLASDRTNLRQAPGSDGLVYPVVVVNGSPVIVGPGQRPKTQPNANSATPASTPVAERPGRAAAGPRADVRMHTAEQSDPAEQAGQALDNARSAREAARARYYSFGLRQKAVDPAGFAKAEADFRVAQQLEADAEAKYQQIVRSAGGAAFRYPTP